MGKVENYISEKTPKVNSPQKGKKLEKKARLVEGKKENKQNSTAYGSSKVDRRSEAECEGKGKYYKSNGYTQKSNRKVHGRDDSRYDQKSPNQSMNNKSYAMERARDEAKDLTEYEQ